MATICWTTYTDPKSFVNVGMDAIAMNSNSVIYFFDLKTKEVSLYKADNMQTGAGIAHLVGHNRFSIFAIAEAIMQPSILIMRYPDFSRVHTISGRQVFKYTDVRFSEYEHLIAISGHPHYTIYVWNIRTLQLIIEHKTRKISTGYSLICSPNNTPVIAQYSELLKEMYTWELCHSMDSTELHEVSTIQIENEKSTEFFACFGDDGILYYVNDYGKIYNGDLTAFKRKLQFSIPSDDNPNSEAMAHHLFYHKSGLILTNKNKIYYIRKKSPQNWHMEWSIVQNNLDIVKMIYNFNNEIYGVDSFGNTFMVDATADAGKLIQQNFPENYLVKKYLLLRGVKEDSALMLTHRGELLLVDIMRNNHFSKLMIEEAQTMAVHNQTLFVAVGTTLGVVHFVSYEKLRAPVVIGILDLNTTQIVTIRLMDGIAVAQDVHQRFHRIHCDYKRAIFTHEAKSKQVDFIVKDYIQVNERTRLVFMSNVAEDPMTIQYIEEIWICQYSQKTHDLKELRYRLPHKYVSFDIGPTNAKSEIELCGIRHNDYVIDIYHLVNLTGLILATTLKTHHMSNVTGVAVAKNLLTWAFDSIIIHFRTHKKSNKSYVVARTLQMHYFPVAEERVEDCLNGKYLLIHQSNGCMKCFKLPQLNDNLRENVIVSDTSEELELYETTVAKLRLISKEMEVFVPTAAETQARLQIEAQVEELRETMRNLIDYDISVNGRTHGAFQKFCLNQSWLDQLNEQARYLCSVERNSLLKGIQDQQRIRDWILKLVTNDSVVLSSKIRSLFSTVYFENYSVLRNNSAHMALFDLYRFYDMEPPTEEVGGAEEEEEQKEDHATAGPKRSDKRFVNMDNMLDHIFDEAFMVSDKNLVTCNQIYNAMVKTKLILIDSLKEEFNKKYNEVKQLKQELMDSIFGTNATLTRIYENMNIMLRLLEMEQFEMPTLSIPEWLKDEVLEQILTVDDSEIKAINRHAKKKEVIEHKSGRMLLWSIDFWVRALLTMMDGVLEKLWEEEIKKDVPIPEFMIKKQDHEYNLEDQKQLREYNEKVHLLAEDRRKYLRILNESEGKTLVIKQNLIMKCNQKVTEMATLKLRYDFAVKQEVLRMMALRLTHHNRLMLRKQMAELKEKESSIYDYITKYTKIQSFWEKAVSDIKAKNDHLQLRDKTLEKQFRNHYLNNIPAHLAHEMTKLFKKRPKMTQKSFNSTLICLETAARITPYPLKNRVEFPLPAECLEFLSHVDAFDDASNAPNQLDAKHWDTFCKLRRQKLENELKIKGIGYQLLDAQNTLVFYAKEGCVRLKDARMETINNMEATAMSYYEAMLNQRIQITLPMGQVEIGVGGSLNNMKTCILMNMSDINEVNELIRTAGYRKLRAMQRVALFRRNVIFKEWEHKVVRANINYLHYFLKVIEKCTVTIEFREVLRKWQGQKERKKSTSVVGILERVIEQKIEAFRKNLDKILDKIDYVRGEIDHMKMRNKHADKASNDIRIAVAMAEVQRDYLGEERRTREQKERMDKIKAHCQLINSVRRDYAHILELSTILELQRLRTYPTLGPPPDDCPEPSYVSIK